MPISKQRNKHIQQVLVEAAKLAPRYWHELALVREKEIQRGNKNRATLAVAQEDGGVDAGRGERQHGFQCPRRDGGQRGSVKTFPRREKHQDRSMRRLPGPADHRPGDEGDSRGSLRFVSGLAENTNSIFCDGSTEPEAANGCPVLLGAGTTSREATRAQRITPDRNSKRALQSATSSLVLFC